MKKHLKKLQFLVLGLTLLTLLTACNPFKKSLKWVEENMVYDVTKVYQTKQATDIFKLFPMGVHINQAYINEKGETYWLDLDADAEKHSISGELVKNPTADNRTKISDVSVVNNELTFSNNTAKQIWPVKTLLYQNLSLSKDWLSEQNVENYWYSIENGSFSITYKNVKMPSVNQMLHLDNQKITSFEIVGKDPKSVYFRKTLLFKFDNNIYFSETIQYKN